MIETQLKELKKILKRNRDLMLDIDAKTLYRKYAYKCLPIKEHLYWKTIQEMGEKHYRYRYNKIGRILFAKKDEDILIVQVINLFFDDATIDWFTMAVNIRERLWIGCQRSDTTVSGYRFTKDSWQAKRIDQCTIQWGNTQKILRNENFNNNILRSIVDDQDKRILRKKEESRKFFIKSFNDPVKEPPKGFMDFAKKNMENEENYMFLEKKGNTYLGYCTHCGRKNIPVKTIPKSYSRYLPSANCPSCHERVQFVSPRRKKILYSNQYSACLQKAEHVSKNGLIFRYYVSGVRYTPNGTQSPEVTNEEPKERVRSFLYFKKDQLKVQNFTVWNSHNIEKNIAQQGDLFHRYPIDYTGVGKFYKKNLSLLKSSDFFKYLPGTQLTTFMNRLERAGGYTIQLEHILAGYYGNPKLEMLLKTGQIYLVNQALSPSISIDESVKASYRCAKEAVGKKNRSLDWSANSIYGLLQIKKDFCNVKRPIKKDDLQYMQILQHFNLHFEDINHDLLKSVYGLEDKLNTIKEYTTFHKAFKYLEGQMKKVHDPLGIYVDYLKMASKGHFNNDGNPYYYNMKDTMILFPKDLKESHDQELNLSNTDSWKQLSKPLKKRIEALKKEYTSIDDDEYCVISPTGGYDIIKEGQHLHICVGKGGYIEKMAQKKSDILFVRKKSNPSKPFITMEIAMDKNGKSLEQARGYRNQNADKKTANFIRKWLNKNKIAISDGGEECLKEKPVVV